MNIFENRWSWIGLFFILALTISCVEEDTTVLPESGSLSGIVTFEGTWPETGSIFISVMKYWITDTLFTGIPSYLTGVSENDVTILTDTTSEFFYSFEEVGFGTYNALAISWRDPEDSDPTTNQHMLGVYGGTIEQFFMDADSVTLSEDIYQLTDIDFTADLGLAINSR